MKSGKARKIFGIGVEQELYAHSVANGFTDINDYIRYLEALVEKKQSQVEALQAELLKINASNDADKEAAK